MALFRFHRLIQDASETVSGKDTTNWSAQTNRSLARSQTMDGFPFTWLVSVEFAIFFVTTDATTDRNRMDVVSSDGIAAENSVR